MAEISRLQQEIDAKKQEIEQKDSQLEKLVSYSNISLQMGDMTIYLLVSQCTHIQCNEVVLYLMVSIKKSLLFRYKNEICIDDLEYTCMY